MIALGDESKINQILTFPKKNMVLGARIRNFMNFLPEYDIISLFR